MNTSCTPTYAPCLLTICSLLLSSRTVNLALAHFFFCSSFSITTARATLVLRLWSDLVNGLLWKTRSAGQLSFGAYKHNIQRQRFFEFILHNLYQEDTIFETRHFGTKFLIYGSLNCFNFICKTITCVQLAHYK